MLFEQICRLIWEPPETISHLTWFLWQEKNHVSRKSCYASIGPDHQEWTILKITGKISQVICLLFLIIVDFLLVICQNNNMLCIYIYVPNRLFLEITSFRWQEENNRLLFSVTGIDNQGHYIRKFPYHDKIMLCKGLL